MTLRNKIILGWLLVAPFLTVLVGGIIFGSYMVIAEAPWWVTVGFAGLLAAIVGSFMLLTIEDN